LSIICLFMYHLFAYNAAESVSRHRAWLDMFSLLLNPIPSSRSSPSGNIFPAYGFQTHKVLFQYLDITSLNLLALLYCENDNRNWDLLFVLIIILWTIASCSNLFLLISHLLIWIIFRVITFSLIRKDISIQLGVL